ncbi:tyramine beta-hydroxylase-like [Crassostrea virginica]|uniref:Tyramine beta-hydroxylase-like n=1 Tax=Crassostrea virginica TaxID=6565 RepID=A0A8B8CDY3_CRAVI|nr:tyramine beta-hydroxylase-like [Crassostrea virginica]
MLLRYICFLLLWSSRTLGFKSFQQRIPNGDSIPHPCKPNFLWHGVGHENELGGGSRNKFGLDFAAAGMKWTKELCTKDSDGDGRTNGEELGDPNCTWEENSTPETDKGLSHPGVCEPHDSDICSPKNTWLNCELENFDCDGIKSPDVKNVTVRFPKTTVPSLETNYFCMTFDLPTDGDYHVIATTPVIDNVNVMHHMLLFGCDPDKQVEIDEPTSCQMGSAKCNTLFGTWTVGSAGQCLYKEAGFRIGQKGIRRVMMQVHWNNPERRSDYQDSSGMTLYFTPNLRANDAAILMIGQTYLHIPPGKDRHTESAVCNRDDTRTLFAGPIHVFRALNHMHYLGREEFVELLRDDKMVTYITNETTYSYDRPKYVSFPQTLKILPGDELKTTCVFKSTNKKKTTFSGRGTNDEMCLAFLTVFPATNLLSRGCTHWGSLSWTKMTKESNPYGCDMTNFLNFSNPDTKAMVKKVRDNCKPFSICLKECMDVVKDIRKHPCLSGDMGKMHRFKASYSDDKDILLFMSMIQSCDLEIMDERSQKLTSNNQSSDSPSPKTGHFEILSLYLLTTFMSICLQFH